MMDLGAPEMLPPLRRRRTIGKKPGGLRLDLPLLLLLGLLVGDFSPSSGELFFFFLADLRLACERTCVTV